MTQGVIGPAVARDVHRRKGRRRTIASGLPILGFGPVILIVALATFWPIVQAVNLAFHDTDFLDTGAFSGLGNFETLLENSRTLSGLGTTAIFTIASTAAAVVVGLVIASLLQATKYAALFETLLLLPWIASQLLGGLIWKFLYSPNVGLFDVAWRWLFPHADSLLGGRASALVCLILTNVWQILPYAVVIISAALKTVPPNLNEAARVDGASTMQLHLQVLFPQIRRSILVVTIMLSLHSFNMVQLPLVMTGGGPADATNLTGMQVYRDAFVSFQFGQASALALAMLLVNVAFTVVYIRFLGKASD